jgi:hydrogenase-4 component F
MALAATIVLPLLLGLLAAALPSNRARPTLLPVAAACHLAATLSAVFSWPFKSGGEGGLALSWLGLDAPGKLVLLLVSVLFFCCSLYCVGYLRYRLERSNRVFVACLLGFLSAASLAAWSRHLGLTWVAIEATTLSTAPLIYFNRSKRSIEATWKYLLVCSVGIALALLGTFFLAYSAIAAGLPVSLMNDDLARAAAGLSRPWLRAAFVLILVGYGTKMGLAPMHTWKPDAYGEAPGVVGAIFAGGVTSCAFLAFLRVDRVCACAGEGAWSSRLLLVMGLFSMAIAALFMIAQRDFKRMLAYGSVEHAGILAAALGFGGGALGLGSGALYGGMLQLVAGGLAKGLLFLSAGNIHRAYASKSTDEARGAMRRLPLSGALFVAGFLATTGSPPFGPFIGLFSILSSAVAGGRGLAAALFGLLLLAVFAGMGRTALAVAQGRPPTEAAASSYRDGFLTTAPALILLALVLLLGLWIPVPLESLMRDAASFMQAAP